MHQKAKDGTLRVLGELQERHQQTSEYILWVELQLGLGKQRHRSHASDPYGVIIRLSWPAGQMRGHPQCYMNSQEGALTAEAARKPSQRQLSRLDLEGKT